MMQRDVAFFLGIEFHQRKIDHPNEGVIFFWDQSELFAQMQAQIAERVMDDLGSVGREQYHVTDLRLGDSLDRLLLGL